MAYPPPRDLLNTARHFTRPEGTTHAADDDDPTLAAAVLPLLAAYGALAPSPHNSQPWEFRVHANVLDICLDAGRGGPLGNAAHREPVIGCGAALFNAQVALRHFGYHDVVRICPELSDDRVIARIQAGHPVRESDYNRALFHAIPQRHTLRARGHVFEPRAIPTSVVEELSAAVRASGAWLHIATDVADKCTLADLVFEAGEEYAMAAGILASEDGLDGPLDLGVLSADADVERVAHAIVVAEAHRASRTLRAAPVVAVLGTDRDRQVDWVAAGQALEHLLLCAATHGIFAAYANQPLRVSGLRPWVKASAGHEGEAHVLLGLGFAPPPSGPPRRSIADLLA